MFLEEVFAIQQDSHIGVVRNPVKFAVDGQRLDGARNELSVIWPLAEIVV
jgi:hypothetical protein